MKKPNNLLYITTLTDINNKKICLYVSTSKRLYGYINGEIPANGKIIFNSKDQNPNKLPMNTFYDDEQIFDIYFKNGFLHREDGPAIVSAELLSEEQSSLFYYMGQNIGINDLIEMFQSNIPIGLMTYVLGAKE